MVDPHFKANRNIVRNNANGHYMVIKQTDGVRDCYGTFKDLESARHERDVCVACGWDYNRIVEWED